VLRESDIGDKAYELPQANDWVVRRTLNSTNSSTHRLYYPVARGVEVKLIYRDIHSRDWDVIDDPTVNPIILRHDGLNDRNTEMLDRCKILVEITFRRNWQYWFWKIMFPLDVITAVGLGTFLLVPEVPDTGPTADQRIAMFLALVTVLVAQAAFTIAARPLLPKVSHTTVLDIHNNFCFLLTAMQAIISAAVPASHWRRFGNAQRFSTFGGTLFLLGLEHVVTISLYAWLSKCTKRQPKQSREAHEHLPKIDGSLDGIHIDYQHTKDRFTSSRGEGM